MKHRDAPLKTRPWLRRRHDPGVKGAASFKPDFEADYRALDGKILRGVWQWMAPYRNGYLFMALAGLLMSGLELITPRFLQQLVDTDIPGVHLNIFSSWLLDCASWIGRPMNISRWHRPDVAYLNITTTIFIWALTMGAALLIQRQVIWYTTYYGQRVLFNLRAAVFRQLQRLSMNYYDRTRFGRILTRGTGDIDSMSNFIVWGINTLVNNLAMMLLAAAMMLWLDWRIALSVLWLGPVLYITNILYRRRIGHAWRLTREGWTRVSTNLAENISGMRVVNAFNRQYQNLDVFNDLQAVNTANNMHAALINGIYQPLLGLISFLGRLIIIALGAWMLLRSSGASAAFHIGKLIAVYVYWDWFMGPVINFGNFYNDTMMALACAERVQTLLAEKPQVTDVQTPVVIESLRGEVVFDHVTFGYDSAHPVIHDVSFRAAPGEVISLVGHTGCGKSTIISLICRFYLPQQGRITFDGIDIREVEGANLHRFLGIVSQNNYLFTGTVMENIRYARPEASDRQVLAALSDLGCLEQLESLPGGLQSQVGERGGALSLGQRQLICFARAFLADPRILLLDEATSAIDTYTELVIQQALARLVKNRTTFIVAHRLSTITGSDCILVMDHGRIKERGTHDQLLALGGMYAELYRQFISP
ncbi:MAG: ABC transporter ATP-binding protein [Phycisphaerae bacterium]